MSATEAIVPMPPTRIRVEATSSVSRAAGRTTRARLPARA
jgi:hypothetical protein